MTTPLRLAPVDPDRDKRFLFVFYATETGRITGTYLGFQAEVDQHPDPSGDCDACTKGVMRAPPDMEVHPDTHFIGWLGGNPVARRRTPLEIEVGKTTIRANGTDAAVFEELPRPVSVVVDEGKESEDTIEVDDGVFEFAADVPGAYALTFRRWPFLDTQVLITATP